MEAMLKWGLVLTRCSLRFEGRQREAAIHEWITFCVGSYGGEEVLFVLSSASDVARSEMPQGGRIKD
jgi:hypothetical protein